MGVCVRFGIKNAGGIEFLHFDSSGAVDDALGIDDDTHMRDASVLVVEER